MKVKYNLIGDSFTHLTGGNKGYSTHGKISKNIEWIHKGHGNVQETFNSIKNGDQTFYVDYHIQKAFLDNNSSKKYGMVLENGWQNEGLINDIKSNLDKYMSTFDMIFTWNEELVESHERIKFIPGSGSWIREPQIYPKNKLVSIIASNKSFLPGHNDRLHMIEQLKDRIPLFGRGFNEIEFKEEALSDYMFSISIENKDDWFTEKLLDCFLCGTVPIFYGIKSIGKWFNTKGMIILEDGFDVDILTPELYNSMKPYIQENFERALKMEVLEDFIYENYLKQ